jgi:hypothetical protein
MIETAPKQFQKNGEVNNRPNRPSAARLAYEEKLSIIQNRINEIKDKQVNFNFVVQSLIF